LLVAPSCRLVRRTNGARVDARALQDVAQGLLQTDVVIDDEDETFEF
jgi:hypothetical protein